MIMEEKCFMIITGEILGLSKCEELENDCKKKAATQDGKEEASGSEEGNDEEKKGPAPKPLGTA